MIRKTITEIETIKFGEEIVNKFNTTKLFILKGEVGSGKTVLVKGMAIGLGIKENITSPTFGLKKEYDGLTHYDLYFSNKLNSKEFNALIAEDLDNENIVVIEWGDIVPKKFLGDYVLIEIINKENMREIIVKRNK